MFAGLTAINHKLVGWGWMLWDVEPFRARTADRIVRRFLARIAAGDIVVMHDGDDASPRKQQPHVVEATRRLIPELRARGFGFGTIC